MLALTGCSNETKNVAEIEIASSTDTATSTNVRVSTDTDISTDTDANEIATLKVTYTEEENQQLEKNLQEYHTVNIEEKITNGLADDSVVNTTSNLIQVSTSNGVTIADIGGEVFADRVTSNEDDELHLSVDTNGIWKEDEGTSTNISWNVKEFKSALDVYNYITDSIKLDVDTQGTSSQRYEYYVIEQQADEDTLNGVDYDSLGNKTVTVIIKDSIPVSYITEVTFTKEDVEYKTQTTYMFEFSDTEISMPQIDTEY
jgi:hypothetical protein